MCVNARPGHLFLSLGWSQPQCMEGGGCVEGTSIMMTKTVQGVTLGTAPTAGVHRIRCRAGLYQSAGAPMAQHHGLGSLNNTRVFSPSPGSWKSKIKASWGWFLVRPPSSACRWSSSRGHPSVHNRVLISSPYDTSYVELGPTPVALRHLITSFKTPSPNLATF